MVASGFAGLGYQIVWTQQSALWLGHEAAAVLAVVTAFFGGLALGAMAFGPRIDRSARPARWYAACEVAIAAWSVALALLMAPVSAWMLDAIGAQPGALRQWTIAFGGSFLLLLPATAAMGATLPAMERVMAAWRGPRQALAGLYAANTFGAVLGVLATAFWLVPQIGLARTAAVCAALNLVCAAAVLRLADRAGRSAPAVSPASPGSQASPMSSAPPVSPASPASQAAASAASKPLGHAARAPALLGCLAATGLLGIGYEVLVVRVLSQVTENTVYTFAILLAVYLVGTALGAAAYQRALRGAPAPVRTGERLLCALAAACLLGSLGLWGAEDLRDALLGLLGAGLARALAVETVLALAAFALPTIAMGALFSHLSSRARAAGVSFGRALAFNTLGAAAAPPLFGVLLAPMFGPKAALVLVAAGYLALTSPRAWRRPAVATLALASLALAFALPPLAFVDVPEGGRILRYREGALAAVSVVEDAEGVSRLRINNRQQEGSSATRLADARQAVLPLLLHPAPKRALFLGVGTGSTAASAAVDPALDVDAVDLLPEVLDASAHFLRAFETETPDLRQRLHLMSADARRFVRAAGPRYDLVVSDNFHPARSGSGSLYTVEHFRAVNGRLAAGGVFCQWLPLHQLDLETLRSIVASFVAVNPGASALLATNSLETPVLGLVARQDGGRVRLSEVRARLAGANAALGKDALGLADEFAVLGSFVAGPAALAAFASGAPLNTDDRPVVAYRAPRITYAPDSLPRERLLALLERLHAEPAEIVDVDRGPADAGWPPRLAAYWAARDGFLAAGRDVRPSGDLQAMLAQVREPLLAALRQSPDFRPAYDPLLRMALALRSGEPAAARELLEALRRAQPARVEAAEALRALEAPAP